MFRENWYQLWPKKLIKFCSYTIISRRFIIPRRSRRDIGLASSVRPSVCPSIPSIRPSALFVCSEPYLSTYWSDWYHKLRKTFSKFYRRYYDLISKFQVGLKSLLRQGLSEPDFYGDLVYKLKKIVGSNNFSAQFIKIISHYKKIGYNINVLQQTACLVVNPITVGNFAFLFNCTPVGQTSDSMMVPT